ncbi:MAG: porin OmpL1 [Leptospiraceae bacterium]|nr:porin OmpL1 [Leptospiraceae bacterium]MDW7976813.1 porin OmpL1 [Leptospiraceae bacterium]
MSKKFTLLLAISFVFVGALYSQSAYLGYGLGVQFNVGDLGSTITKDGLDNAIGDQKIIIPENTIDVWSKSGFAKAKISGAMHGGILNVFYERESTSTFWRVGLEYTKKILGGKTSASILGIYQNVSQNWDFVSYYIPFIYGIKAGVGEASSVYGGIGINYHRGGWSLSGTVDGATPCFVGLQFGTYLLCGFGPWGDAELRTAVAFARQQNLPTSSILNTVDQSKFYRGAIFGEKVVFDVNGVGYNLVIGFENRLQNKSKFYIEIEYFVGGGMDNAPVQAIGTISQLASTGNLSYPVNLSGIRWKLGLKQPL